MKPPQSRRLALIISGIALLLAISWLLRRSDDPRHQAEPPQQAASPSAAQPPSSDPNNAPQPRYPLDLPLDQVTLQTLPLKRDREELLREAEEYSASGVNRFATPIDVRITPATNGTWDLTPEGNLRWRLLLHSPQALSLNFGFTQYEMPEGGALRISTPGAPSPYRDFTDADNEVHRQLWTPILNGDTALLEVELPPGAEPTSLDLELTRVNHGLRPWHVSVNGLKIGGDTSGNCNLDVVCLGTDTGSTPLIENYRDQIRSSGAYTLNGFDNCSGAAINNTALDAKPYFLTAEHCDVNIANAPTVVVYWNFQNSTCRTPNTAASGAVGDGPLTQFNTGAIFRSEWSAPNDSDFNLLELDDPIDPAYDVFFAGWNRALTESTMSVAVHHPSTAEKRISFDFDPSTTTSYNGASSPGNGSYIRVADWDIGTTEPGSSGSPLFDENGRIIGQLTGGDAACGNNDPDWYGRFSSSWTGGGTAATRLSDWLDPIASGATTLDGDDFNAKVSIDDIAIVETNAGTVIAMFTVTLDESVPIPTSVNFATQDLSALEGSDYVANSGTVNFAATDTSEMVSITINGDMDVEDDEFFKVILSTPVGLIIDDGEGICEITTDDYILPVITSALIDNARVGDAFSHTITADNTPRSFGLSGAIPAGMSFDTNTGIITWTPTIAGVYPLTITATNPAGSDMETITITITEHPVLLGIDQNGSGRLVDESALNPWTLVASPAQDTVDSAQSGTITHSETTYFETTVTGPDTVLFYWKVDSEERFDYLSFYLDGELVTRISGNVDWNREALTFPAGEHTLRWEYSKDATDSTGLDRGWVDQVIFASDFAYPLVTSAFDPCTVLGGVVLYEVLSSKPNDTDSITVAGLPGGLVADADGVIRQTGATTPGIYPLTLTLTNSEGTDIQTVNLELIAAIGLATALDVEALDIAAGSTTPSAWLSQSTTTRDTVDAAQSALIGHLDATTFKIIVNGPGTVSFWWNVSSEDGFDFLYFSIDDVILDAITGLQVVWTQITRDIPPGVHELSWTYEKDLHTSHFSDAGWIDELTFTGYAGWIAGENVGGRSGLHIDAEYDGYTNIEDYYFNQGAMTTDPHNTPARVVVGGNQRLTIPKRLSATDVSATVEVATDLSDFSTTNTNIISDTPTELIVEETYPGPKPPSIYMRAVIAPK